jgi:two-component system NtrC family response regulator
MVVDDEPATVTILSTILQREGMDVLQARDIRSARSLLASVVPDVMLVDVHLGGDHGLRLVEEVRVQSQDAIGIIVISAEDTNTLAKQALDVGANNFLGKPINASALLLAIRGVREMRTARQRAENLEFELERSVRDTVFPDIVTHSDAMRAVLALVQKVARRELSALICGESGTGKELVARAIHSLSSRKARQFVELNCAALPPNLVESELFGHEKGAFTGAIASRAGKIEQANGGTLFLDEIGELPLEIQPKLLRALQERRFTRVGGRDAIESDFRLVCATNRDLVTEVRQGRFREDLFYRVAVFPIKLPPLRDRIHDIELLLSHFLAQERAGNIRYGPGVIPLLKSYHWPGNIRELKNFAQAMTLLAENGTITEDAVVSYFGSRIEAAVPVAGPAAVPHAPADLPRPVRPLSQVEREEILNALRVFRGNVPEAARALDMGRATLYKYIKRENIDPGMFAG